MKAMSPPLSRLAACLLAMFPFAAAPGEGRSQEADLVDRVVAIVGDSVVLLSEIIQREVQMGAEGVPLPPERTPQRDSIRERILDELIDIQLILQAAARDTLLQVDEDQIEAILQQAMDDVEGRFPNRDELERALAEQGLSLQTFREMRRNQLAQDQLVRLYLHRNLGEGAIEVTEDEMRAFFEDGRAGLQQRPATVAFRQVVIPAAPSDSVRNDAIARIEGLLERVRAGEDFGELATLYSQDQGSAEAGGVLGWFRQGSMTKDFEDAAFALYEGGVSDVVETEYGFHIIKIDRVRGAERQARHIFIRPDVGPADIERSRRLAEEIALRARSEEFQVLVDAHHDSSVPDSARMTMGQVAQQLPSAYTGALTGRRPGEVVGPIQFNTTREHFAVLKIVEVREAGEYTFEDLRESIRAGLITEKRRVDLIEGLREKMYVEILGN